MDDLRLSTTTYGNSLNRLQEAQQEKKTQLEAQKSADKKTTEIKSDEAANKKADSKEPIKLSISEEGMKTLNDSKDGSVAAKEKEESNVISISRASRMEDFSLDAEESSKIQDMIKEEQETDEAEKATEAEKEKPPVTSFAGMTSAQIQTLYQQGRISYQTYMSKTEAKEEAREEQIEEINDTQADIVGLEAIKNQLLHGMPDQIKAEIA